MKIAIFGAGGGIGRAVLPELLRCGHEIRLVGRSSAKLAPLAGPHVEIVTADLADAGQARRAADGVDAILYAVGVPYPQFELHPVLVRNAISAAQSTSVRQFLLVSNVYPYGRAQSSRVAETHPREPHTAKGRYRKVQADLVLAAHNPAGLQTAVLVLPDFYGPTADLSVVKDIFDAALTAKTANVVGPLDTPHEYVYLPDVAPVVVGLFAQPQAFGRTYNFAGPGLITLREFVAAVDRAAGTHIKLLVANKTLLRLLGIFNPLVREIVEMYYLFTDPVVLDDAALYAVLPTLTKTSYDVGIAATIAALREQRELEPAHG